MITKTLRIPPKLGKKPIDIALTHMCQDLSRRHIRRILDAGGIRINNVVVKRASQIVQSGDTVLLSYEKHIEKKIVLKKDTILYHDKDILAVFKPAGVPSVETLSGKIPHMGRLLRDSFGSQLPKTLLPCHRLDKETSGVMLFATSKASCENMMTFFKERNIRKTYLALVWGIPKADQWTVQCYLSDIDKKTGMVKPVRAGGKPSLTEFETIAINKEKNISLLLCKPHTGRSHQIRVHLGVVSELPIVGDKKYDPLIHTAYRDKLGGMSITDRHFLHAFKISWGDIEIKAPYPKDMVSWFKKDILDLSSG